MSAEKKDYFVVKPIVHRNQSYKTGARVSLTEREAHFLVLAGKISVNKPSTKKGLKNVKHDQASVSD